MGIEMKEKNRHVLEAALRELPSYHPDEAVWGGIRQQLADQPLQKALRDLPQYDPPDLVWEGISQELEDKPTAKVRRLPWRRWSAAAGFLLLLGMAWLLGRFLQPNEGMNVKVSYSVEEVDSQLLAMDWNADEEEFAQLTEICERYPFMCNRPDIQSLRRELTDLTNAKFQLVDVLGPYGTDLNLISQLNKIEMERTRLLKQILTEVI
jgi:hypothetical protein